ncbi:MAG: hypothetical protein GY847_20170 [Proteobacteria bacterium]|nr:hypothetical protein [Pseudomonadota bacterium]
MSLADLTPIELLRLNAETLEELRRREILTTSNAPLGDYAEWLFRKTFSWSPAGNSAKDVDAIGSDGARYQIKARRLTQRNKSRQLGALRRLDEENFDWLAAALFNEDFSVMRAALIPFTVVKENAKRVEATNSWRFILRENVWDFGGVRDCTQNIQKYLR